MKTTEGKHDKACFRMSFASLNKYVFNVFNYVRLKTHNLWENCKQVHTLIFSVYITSLHCRCIGKLFPNLLILSTTGQCINEITL